MLGELTSLSRDLLIRQTAPAAGLTLMAGGYDEATLNTLAKKICPRAAHRHAGTAGAGHRGLQALGRQPHRGRNLPGSGCATPRWTAPMPVWPPGSPSWKRRWRRAFPSGLLPRRNRLLRRQMQPRQEEAPLGRHHAPHPRTTATRPRWKVRRTFRPAAFRSPSKRPKSARSTAVNGPSW